VQVLLSKLLQLNARLVYGLGLLLVAATTSQAQTIVPGKIPGQFAVSPSGAATYSIPIQVPPGIAGMEPKLSLNYNSQAGNGIMGMGWNLGGLSSITRCPQTKAQDGPSAITSVNYDSNDKFCMDGQRLIVVNGEYGATGSEYRTEVESFSQITAVGQIYGEAPRLAPICYTFPDMPECIYVGGAPALGPSSFTVKTKAGLTMKYGFTDKSRIEAQGKAAVMVWTINEITDIRGNSMSFDYYEDNASGSFLPATISYAGNVVTFVYDTTQRPDIQIGYQAGSKVTLLQRLKSINTYVGLKTIATTKIQYSQSPDLQRSNVSSVQLCDGADTCLVPMTVSSNEGASNGFLYSANQDIGGWDGSATGVRELTMDVNGDGKTDLVRIWNNLNQANAQVWLGNGTGFTYGGNQEVGGWRSDADNAIKELVIDVNGDGKSDLMRLWNNNGKTNALIWLGNGTGFVHAGNQDVGGWDGSATGVRELTMDVNGDGKTDLVRIWNNLNRANAQVWNASSAASPSTMIISGPNSVGVSFTSLNANSTIYTRDTTSIYPKVDLQIPMQVVSQVDTSNGVGGVNSIQYSYGGLKAEQGTGRGMLGFRWMQSKELSTGIESRTEFSQEWPYTGMPVKSETRLAGYGNGGLLKRSTSTPACKIPQNSAACTNAAGNRYFPYIASTLEESWELNGGIALPTVSTNTEYTNAASAGTALWGDPLRITVTSNDGASKVIVNEYEPANTTGGNWILGRLKQATVTSSKP
jgi:Salmonella virulence plasmid 65kDa B protein/FG-GAP-like repeat